jgi:hypothetical protein
MLGHVVVSGQPVTTAAQLGAGSALGIAIATPSRDQRLLVLVRLRGGRAMYAKASQGETGGPEFASTL